MNTLRAIVLSRRTEKVVIGLIILNAVILGLETSAQVMSRFGPALILADRILLGVFTLEIAARIAVHRRAFFRDPWSLFDFVVVAVALVPTGGAFSVLRALRVLRVLRLITVAPSLRRVVSALISALPGMGAIIMLLGLIFYVGSVMAVMLFGHDFPEEFGDLGRAAFSLFQIMTLDSWSSGFARPVMAVHPSAWAFFVPFVLVTAFTMLNLFIGVVVNAMQAEHEAMLQVEHEEVEEQLRQAAEEREQARLEAAVEARVMTAELKALRAEIADLRAVLSRKDG